MRIVLWILRLFAVLVAVMASAVLSQELTVDSGSLGFWVVVGTLLAYAFGLGIALLRVQLEPFRPRRAWLALAPLICQLTVYLVYWAVRFGELFQDAQDNDPDVVGFLAILAFLAFLSGFPAALPAGLVFRRARALLAVEALGPPVFLLVAGVMALLQ